MSGQTPSPVRGRARARSRTHAPSVQLPPPGMQEVELAVEGVVGLEAHMLAPPDGSGSRSGSGHEGSETGSSTRGHGSPRGGRSEAGTELVAQRGYLDGDNIRTRPNDFNKEGSSGMEVKMITNYYKYRLKDGFLMRLYTVAVTVQPPSDEVDDKKLKRILRTQREQLGNYILTGNQLFTTQPIREDLLENGFQLDGLPNEDPPRKYHVILTYLREVELNDPIAIHFFNVLIKTIQGELGYRRLGRHYFDPSDGARVNFETWRLELWPGFNNSIRCQEDGLMMNVESCWKVLMKQSVLQMMTQIRRQFPDRFVEECNKAIVGLVVVTRYNPRAYKISRIDYNSNPSKTFESSRGTRTFEEYYQTRWEIQIESPQQPMLVSEPSRADQRRGQVGDIYLVPELCFPCGLNDELRANLRLMKDLAGCLHALPGKRVQVMQQFIERVSTTPPVSFLPILLSIS